MKTVVIFALITATVFSAPVDPPTWQELHTHLFTNASIVWQAPTNNLPKSFWIYQRDLPHVFSATVISNAIVLGSLQSKGFPKPSTNDFYIWEEKKPNYPGPIFSIFSIRPSDATMSFQSPNFKERSQGIPSDEAIIKRAWDCVPQFGLVPTNLVQKNFYIHRWHSDEAGNKTTNVICGRGIILSRQLDGVAFFSADNDADGGEGFSMEFGNYGQIRFFSLRWSNMERYRSEKAASLQQIIQSIRKHKTFVLPNSDEEGYFERLQILAKTKKLTITKITPYYGMGVFGEIQTNNVPCKFVTPFAELEAVADFGNSNSTLRLLAPIISTEVDRLLKTK